MKNKYEEVRSGTGTLLLPEELHHTDLCRDPKGSGKIFFHQRHVVNCSRLDVELRVGSWVRFCRREDATAAVGPRQQAASTEARRVYVDITSDTGKERNLTSVGNYREYICISMMYNNNW
jgi:hypothetical protein